MKKIKSGKKYYYYIVKDVYDSVHKRSTTVIVRKANDDEVAEYEASLKLKKQKSKYKIRLYLKSNEIKFKNFAEFDEFQDEVIKILKSPDTKKIIINYL